MNRKKFIEESLVKAADYLLKSKSVEFKYSDRKGYLSSADVAVNSYLKKLISEKFPNDCIYSEEGNEIGGVSKTNYIWIIDPICGTTNFVRGIPFYVHSLCVLDKNEVLYAGVYDPNRKELFIADRNSTTLNGIKVESSKVKDLDKAIVSVNCNQSSWKDGKIKIMDLVEKFAPPTTRRVKIFESANLELAYVACGRLDAYICPDDRLWNIAAGSLMIDSAGGETKTLKGSINEFEKCKGVIATNAFLMEPISKTMEDDNNEVDNNFDPV